MQSRTAAKKSAGSSRNKQNHNRKRKGKNYGPKRFDGMLDNLSFTTCVLQLIISNSKCLKFSFRSDDVW